MRLNYPNLCFCLFLAVLGLHCWAGFSLVTVNSLSGCSAWASHCCDFPCCGAWAPGSQASAAAHGLNHCGSWALEHRLSSWDGWASLTLGMWDLSGFGIEPMSPARVDSLPLSHQGSPHPDFLTSELLLTQRSASVLQLLSGWTHEGCCRKNQGVCTHFTQSHPARWPWSLPTKHFHIETQSPRHVTLEASLSPPEVTQSDTCFITNLPVSSPHDLTSQ